MARILSSNRYALNLVTSNLTHELSLITVQMFYEACLRNKYTKNANLVFSMNPKQP